MTAVARPAGPGRRAGAMPPGARLKGGDRQPKAPLTWRGHGGASATPNSVEFDKQLDKISLWLEHWSHETRCMVLERLLRESNYVQLKLLWTVLQPALHRDFMYTATKQYPTEDFRPISTYTGREVMWRLNSFLTMDLSRLSKTEKMDYHRIQSAHMQLPAARGGPEVTLPAISLVTPTSSLERMTDCSGGTRTGRNTQQSYRSHHSPSRMSKLSYTTKASSFSKSSTISKSTRMSVPRSNWSWSSNEDISSRCQGALSQHPVSPQTASSPCIRFIEMPVRRHIQEESSPRRYTSDDLFRDDSPVGGTTAPVVPILANRWGEGWKTPVPVPITANIAPLTDTQRAKGKVKVKVKVKAVNPGQVTFTQPDKNDTNTEESRFPKMDNFGGPKRVVMTSASVDIPPEGWQLLHWYTTTWNALQRNEFLHKLLIKMDQRQHYYISSLLSVKHHIDIVGLLPEALALRIVSYLKPKDLLVALRVSKKWFKLCNNNGIWKRKCHEIKLEIPVVSSNPNWKSVFKDNKSITNNWSTGTCNVVECKGHHQKVLSVIFDGSKMATGSADKTIRIWDVSDGRCIQTLRGHEKGVWALRFFTDNLLISASYDSTIRVWNMKEGTSLRTLIGHSGPVWAIELAGNTLVSASQDGTAKVWDIRRCLLQKSLRGHGGPVFCVDLDDDGKLAVTGSSDRTVRLWNTDSGRQLRLIWVPGNSVMAVSCSRGWIAASHGTSVSLYERNGKQHSTFDEHIKRVECLELKIKDSDKPTGLIISAGKDGVMKQWDIAKGECTKTFVVSKSQVNCIHFDEMRIASAAYDHKIKIWDFTAAQRPRPVSDGR